MTALRSAPALPAGTPPELLLRDLTVGYRDKPVITGLTLSGLQAGHVTALVGPNGAGKSTLLGGLAGLVRASGQVLLDGVDLFRMRPAQRADHFGFMPQAIPQGTALTVLETVISALMASGAETSERIARTRAAQVLERLAIDHLASRTLDHLSGGQRQMCSLAQAIVREPRILLLDEPTSALDMRHQLYVMQSVRQLADEGRHVIVVLHDLSFAAQWADHIVVLRRGQLYSEGNPAATITPGMLADVYGVQARVERCSRGRLQIMADDLVPIPGKPH
ncbi:iron complex transport system ATP-binding protein [Comamonas sp. BIGb0124]|uniref:ABC transporter ATP-binding protein n=1 Tax=Comamonas sp. BIGb0124 TaxID=2485130 RepID=UPI000F4AA157|nr:ABC transporter ATP-binding protein [Comamonas sp. BIGb0124]ROR22964.1 iron complex transport system ATP-binding protein [Comamonas sp. BIGb0124]